MKRMIGMTLMIIGVICFIAGYVTYSSSKKPKEQREQISQNLNTTHKSPDSTIAVPTPSPSSSEASEPVHKAPPANDLDKIIEMAVADGVLTSNERSLIKEIANTRGLNYNVIIRDVENRISNSGAAETEIIDVNKKNGNDFEKFVVQKFDKRFFKIKEWAGDKYVNGAYAETTQNPDLVLEFALGKQKAEFAVECKWKGSFYRGGIEFATPEQVERYQAFENKKKNPVYIAIGVGGKGESPEQLFIVPLRAISSNFIPAKELYKYKKNIEKNFYFDLETQKLN